jgi:uncharacterized membrane protein
MGSFRLALHMGQDGAIYTFLKLLFLSEVVLLSSVQDVIGYFNSQRL